MQELQVNIEQAKVEIVGQEVFEKGIADVVAKYQNYTVTAGTIKDDKKQSTWNAMPATMIRKTALVNALREAFPEDLGSMYTEDDGGETFDRIKDVTPQETQEDVRARKMAQIEQMKQEQSQFQQTSEDSSQPVINSQNELVQGELLDY